MQTGDTQPVDIPHGRVSAPEPVFVESPDALTTHSLGHSLSSSLNEAEGHPPLLTLRRGTALTHFPSITSVASFSTARLSHPSNVNPRPDHQWTVFSQLMEQDLRPTSSGNIEQSPTEAVRPVSQPIRNNSVDSLGLEDSVVTEPLKPSPPTFFQSPITRNVLKCAIAYFVASLFTFSPYFTRLISDVSSAVPGSTAPSPSGHMVATIAVYFNPAKTIGAMLEADLFCFFGLIYAGVVCLVSMAMFWWLEHRPGLEWLGDVVAVVWIIISMGLLAWLKVWMANPSFNTACSMTAILIFVVLVKEGGWETLKQVTVIILYGVAISNITCFLVWPTSGLANLLSSMTTTLESFSTLLHVLTELFLLENEDGANDMDKVRRAIENHQKTFTILKKNLNEAKSEWPLRNLTEPSSTNQTLSRDFAGDKAYEDAVDSLNRLAQHLNGLRSGTQFQRDLLRDNATEETTVMEGSSQQQHSGRMFKELVDELAPPLRALSSSSITTLNTLRQACQQARRRKRASEAVQPHDFTSLVEHIEAALLRFESTSNHAVVRLYRRSDIGSHPITESTSQNLDSSQYLLDDRGEDIFVVYFFIFTLQEFAKELIALVDAIERVYYYEQRRLHSLGWWRRLWIPVANLFSRALWSGKNRSGKRLRGLHRSLSSYMTPVHRRNPPIFPKVQPHAPDTVQTPPLSTLTFVGKMSHILWATWKRLNERDAKYAMKAGLATAVLASASFIESTRATFLEYQGDWALISCFVVLSPTIGATNHVSLQRLLGTMFGALVAVGIYRLFPDNAIVLSTFGFIFSLPCFYFAVSMPQYLSASRFVLLTYNLTCLYSYNLRQGDTDVTDIGFRRTVSVTAGILWAAFVCRFWWPSEARRELSKGLGEFCLNIGWLYTHLVAFNSHSLEPRPTTAPQNGRNHERLPSQLNYVPDSIHEFMAMELHLQIKLIELQTLLAQAQHEPRLKGPFPVDLYRTILTSLQSILDRLHSMRCVTTREEWHTSVRQDFIIPVNKERHEMVGNTVLCFFILASAFQLKAPLPPYLPPAEKSRLRLVEAIRRLDVVKNRDVKASRQLLFFAYALTMKGVTKELEALGSTLQEAFGVIGQKPEEFNLLFSPNAYHSTLEHVA